MRQHSPAPDDLVLTVSELTRKIRAMLQRHWAAVWVEGELSNVKHHASGHVYYTLKDEGASLFGVIWRSDARRIRFRPEDGQKVRVFGQLTVYERYGNYQIQTRRMEPHGTGDLELAFRQMYERLEREGLFDPGHKLELPEYPNRLGLVTSESGAALHDMLTVFARRAPHIELVLVPVRVQGDGAAEGIAAALAALDEWGACDAILLARGGGSLEDLWAFNEEAVAYAIYDCGTPIITGVGHEVDTTIADWAADHRAPTPSAAAEIASPDREELLAEVEGYGQQLVDAIHSQLDERRRTVARHGASRAFADPLAYVRQRAQDLDQLVTRLSRTSRRGVGESRRELESLTGRLARVGREAPRRPQLRLESLAGRLEALSPLGILGRGYAIARSEGDQVVRSAADVEAGDRVEVLLGDGALGCVVEETRSSAPPAATVESHAGPQSQES